ncbi:hypothetical protein AB4Y77_11390 [Paenarthrobacter sp. YAF11_1]|uniref:hypothetical protein n=1 Tax=Paenarthrobacter sp. YAF11_1 TaxID=3233074 RepID=UPI003F9BE6F1
MDDFGIAHAQVPAHSHNHAVLDEYLTVCNVAEVGVNSDNMPASDKDPTPAHRWARSTSLSKVSVRLVIMRSTSSPVLDQH